MLRANNKDLAVLHQLLAWLRQGEGTGDISDPDRSDYFIMKLADMLGCDREPYMQGREQQIIERYRNSNPPQEDE